MSTTRSIQRLTLFLVLAAFAAALCAAPFLADSAHASEPQAAADDADVVPQEFEKHYLVLLVRPDEPAEVDEAEAQTIQSAHLAHLHKLWIDGDAMIAGPFEVPADERFRGLVLYRGDLELEEVRALAEADPAVKAGRLEVKVLPWWHGVDVMHFTPAAEAVATE